jgi:hypothetical protein
MSTETKKGELTTQQIVVIIIIIASFVILLYFLFLMNPAETSLKQICYNSVVLASKGGGLISSIDCKTDYICISGGGSCSNFNPTTTVKIDVSKKDTIKNETLKAVADAMSDCWWMFGQGKLDYVSASVSSELEKVFDNTKPYHCAICSRIGFDDKIQANLKDISYAELYDYMKTHQTSNGNSQSYLKYIYNVNSPESANTPIKDLNSEPMPTSKDYIIITGQDPKLFTPNPYKIVQIISTGEASDTSKTMCGAFDVTKAQ